MIKYYDFDTGNMTRIRKAIEAIRGVDVKHKGFKEETAEFQKRIKAILRDPKHEWSLKYGGRKGECRKWKSYTRGYYIAWVCSRAFTAEDEYGNPRLPAILFHEMVHACGGKELDAETLENVYFRKRGAKCPDPEDFDKFEREGGGRWFTLIPDRRRGVAYVYRRDADAEESVIEFPLPPKKR